MGKWIDVRMNMNVAGTLPIAREKSLDRRIKEALVEIVGHSNFTDVLIDLVSYSYDASDHEHRPEVAIWPTSAEQVSKILKKRSSAIMSLRCSFPRV